MANGKAKSDGATATEMRMLAAQVPEDTYAEFQRVARSHERSVAGELRQLVRDHIEQHASGRAA